jgi:ketosteroid isomerase-like protein
MFLACKSDYADPESLVREIQDVEKEFNEAVASEGVNKGFLAFAAENAIIKRGENVAIGHDEILSKFFSSDDSNVRLTWAPDRIEVARSGDLAYSFGKYVYTLADSIGNPGEPSTGYFCTIWKRQDDGSWKFVFD